MDTRKIFEYYKARHGGINGAVTGFVLTVSILLFGFFKVLFVAAGILAGYLVGSHYISDKNYIKAILDKILPPGGRR